MPVRASVFDFTIFGFKGEDLVLSIISIIIGIIAAFVFYRLQKRDSNSARKERTRRANDELVETIESIFINKQEITPDAIDHLFDACSRKYNVPLNEYCKPKDLLQDVMLRIQRSPHLDIKQKNDYITQIESFLNNQISRESETKNGDLSCFIESLDTIIESYDDKEKETIKEDLISLKPQLVGFIESNKEGDLQSSKWSFISAIVTGMAVSSMIFTLITVYTSNKQKNNLKKITSQLNNSISEIENKANYKLHLLEQNKLDENRIKIIGVAEEQKALFDLLKKEIEKQKSILSLKDDKEHSEKKELKQQYNNAN